MNFAVKTSLRCPDFVSSRLVLADLERPTVRVQKYIQHIGFYAKALLVSQDVLAFAHCSGSCVTLLVFVSFYSICIYFALVSFFFCDPSFTLHM